MQRRRVRVRKFLVLVALGCLFGMTTRARIVVADDRSDGEPDWQVHSGHGLADSIHLTGAVRKWELPAENNQFSCRVSTEADGLRMTVNEYGTQKGAVILSVKDGGFSAHPMSNLEGSQLLYFRFDEDPWIRKLFEVTGGAMTAASGAKPMPLRGGAGAKAILEGLERGHRHLHFRWVPLYGPSYRIATLNINGYDQASAECKQRMATASSIER